MTIQDILHIRRLEAECFALQVQISALDALLRTLIDEARRDREEELRIAEEGEEWKRCDP